MKECALVNCIVPFVLLPFIIPITGEYHRWPGELYYRSSGVAVIICLLSIALCESKHIDRFSKYAIVENTSTLFFAGVDSAMKMLAGIMSFFFFSSDDPSQMEWPTLVGFGFVCIAVLLLYLDKRAKSLQAQEYKAVSLLQNEHGDHDPLEQQDVITFEPDENTPFTSSGLQHSPSVVVIHRSGTSSPLNPIQRVKSKSSIFGATTEA